MAAYTPGPWNYRPLAGQRKQWVILAGDRYPLATVGTVEADACLIAAAPALLDALENLREAITDTERIRSEAYGLRILAANAAIAKAEGRD
jgi:hypothetical protein